MRNDTTGTQSPTDNADLPSDAYRLGVDEVGREHWHSAYNGTVWVFRDGDLIREEDLGGRSVVDWVLFIDQCHEGWQDHEPVDETNGFAGLARDICEEVA